MNKMKKGQEEITGFVLIVVIVAIIFVILLAIFIRKDTGNAESSIEISNFLDSVIEHTSSCATSFEPDYSKTGELVQDCYQGKRCLSGEDACYALNSTISEILEKSWSSGEENAVKGYRFRAVYYGEEEEDILKVEKGVCGSVLRGAERPITGNLGIEMVLCY